MTATSSVASSSVASSSVASSVTSAAAFAALLAHPAIWRGDTCAPEPSALPSGFATLDAVLPGHGWPQGALTEMLLEQ